MSQAEFSRFFDEADRNGDGTLSKEELRQVLRKKGYSSAQSDAMFRSVDTSNDGELTKQEFLVAMGFATEDDIREAQLRNSFNAFDLDGNGYIDQKELQQVIQEQRPNMTDAEAKRMVELAESGCGATRDGKISYEEFVQTVFRKK